LPEWFKQISTAITLVTELLVPLLVFAPRRWRRLSFLPLVGLQLFIALSGNYAWFNWLTIVLAIFVLDDRDLRRVLPRWLRPEDVEPQKAAPPGRILIHARRLFVALVILIGTVQVARVFSLDDMVPTPIMALVEGTAPFLSINGYGPFGSVQTERRELVLEGSDDGLIWKPYEFRWKPGRLDRPPGSCEPHQPRLDWAMCEAPQQPVEENRWLAALVDRLLHGTPEVLALLDGNPFPSAPPRVIRGMLYRYRYTTPEEKDRTGNWWYREPIGVYLAPIELSATTRNPRHGRQADLG
jgi:hypothetical protein